MARLFSKRRGQTSASTAEADKSLPDRFYFQPLVAPAAIALAIGTAHSFLQLPSIRAWFLVEALCVFLGVPALLIWLLTMLVRAAISVRQRRWKTAISRLAMSICIVPLVSLSLWLGPYVHFGLSAPYYLMELGNPVSSGNERTSFHWGGTGLVGSAQTDRWLVYDLTDETAMRTGGPKRVAGDPALYVTEHLLGHFYLVVRHQ